jgi:hypothetical protein
MKPEPTTMPARKTLQGIRPDRKSKGNWFACDLMEEDA